MDFLATVAMIGMLFLGVTVLLAVQSIAFGRRAIFQAKAQIRAPGLLLAADLASVLLIGLGVVVLLLIPTLYWFIHGDYERYIWVIRGPQPFSQFGGGPYQFWLGVCLFVTGSGMIVSGLALRKWFWRCLDR